MTTDTKTLKLKALQNYMMVYFRKYFSRRVSYIIIFLALVDAFDSFESQLPLTVDQ